MKKIIKYTCFIIFIICEAARAATTGVWTPAVGGGSANAGGVTVTLSSALITALPAAGTLNTGGATNFWTNPYGASVVGGPALTLVLTPFGAAGTVTVTFSQPVNNPVLHFARIGGVSAGRTNSSSWTSSSGVPSLLANANPQFSLTGSTFQRIPNQPAAGGLCVAGNAGSTACGSVQITGIGITTLTFPIAWVGPGGVGAADGIDFAVSVPDTTITVTKVSNGGVGSFSFTGTNGFTNQTITTVSSGVGVSGATQTLTSAGSVTTITETVPSGYALASATCTGMGSGGTATLSGNVLTLNAAATVAGSAIACTFTNNLQTPSLSIAKSSTTTSFNAAGVVIPYSYTVTNNGNTTVTSAITVTDNLIPSVTCDPLLPGGLAPNASIACTGSYTTTQADVNAGSVTNTASATDGTTTSPTTQLTIPASQTPSLSIAKSSTTTSFNAAGVVIPYSYTVTNNGNTTVTSAITVTDNLIPSVTCDPLPPGGLAPNASIACTGSYTTTQADVNAGSVTNTASATDGTTTSPTTQLTIPASQTPSLSIAKSSTTTSFNAAGVVIPYSYTVTNNGNTTVTSAITVTDNLIPSVTCDPLLPGGLAPNASIACTGSYTTTQADVNAGSVTNTASATDGTTTSPTTQLTIPASQTPSLSIAKSSTTTSFNAAGVVIPYSYTVTNNGNTTVTSAITVTDNLIPSVTCDPLPPGGLAPNASIACTGSYTTTQADVNAGSVTNTASATDGTTTSPTTQLTIPASQTPSLSIAKSSTTTSFNAAGVVIPYSYTVTNNGNTTVTSAITVTDNLIPSVTCDPLPPGGLAPNASIACTGSYTTTQADVNAGSVTNTASATDGTTTSPTTQLTIPASQTPSLSIAKSSTTTSFNAAGVVIPYSYTVTNNGNTTVTSAITVTDNLIPSVTCDPLPPGGLAPNASIACTGSYTTTQADVNAGSVTNTASATDGTTTSPTTQLTIPASQTPSLSIAKSSTTTSFNAAGVVIPYSYTVTNNGNTTVTSAITVTDNLIPSVTCDPLLPGGLAPNASIACTGSYTTTQADVNAGSVTNTASATDGTTTSPTTQLTIPASQTPSLSIAKSSTTTSFNAAGVVIPYSYTVTNNGNTTVTSAITVTDNLIPSVTCDPLLPGGLAPNASIACTGSYTTTQADVNAGSVTNTASATDGTTTSPTTQLTIPASQTPSLSIAKSSTTTSFNAAGVVIPYSYTVTNNGNTTVTSAITVTDNLIPSVTCDPLPPGGLAPNASIACTGSYTTTQADVNAGSVTNTASATDGTTTSPTTQLTIPASQTPSLSIAKSSTTTSFNAAGVVIPYSYTVTNNGNTTVTSAITVTDNLIPSVTCDPLPPGGLAPNASIACTGSYTTTQADVNAGSVTNTASATDGTTTSPTTQLTIPASQTPSLSIAKSSTTTSFNAAGVVIPYSYTVTNNGNTTVTSAITVTDNLIPSVTCDPLPPGGLAPNASIACTGSYTTTQADVNAGSVTNTASATDGTTTSPTTQLTIPASQTPSLSIAKSSTTTSFNAAGVVIPYSYTVTNNGNTTVTSAITVTDNLIPSVTCDPLPPGGLAPNASIACTGSYTTTQADVNAGSVTNTASATDGTTTSPTTQLTIPASQTPSLSIAKSSTTTSFNAAGVVIPYSYTVTNNGNTTVTSAITVTDNLIPSVTCDPLPPGGLAPNASIACTGSYTTTQADVNAGSVTNTASATDGTTTSPTTQLTIPASQTPSLSIAKSSTTTSFNAAGVVIPYSYTVTNNGNTTVTSAITVTDNLIPSVTCDPLPPGGLAPNASIACTGSYTTTQADVNAGSVTNTASATDGTTTSPTTQLTIPASQTPSLSIAKSSTTTSFNAAGVVIPYSYTVTNNGNTTVTSAITVTDNLIPSVTCDPLLPGGLAPNASIACTGSYTTTQADVNAGSVTNTASATDGTTTSPTTQLTIPASQTPSLSIAKSSTTTSFNAAGVVIPYSYTVTNNGNTTVTSAITVTDNLIPSVTCDPLPPGGLAPNASIACTGSYTTTQADVNAGSVTNTASATDGTTTSPTTQLTIPASQTPSLSIAKSSTTTSFNAAGVVIPYSYTVTNNGNTTVTSAITVTDNLIPSVTCDPLLPGGLAPNASIACTGSYTTTQADVNAGSVTNTASATDGTTTSPTTQLTIPASQTPSLSIAKSSTTTSFNAAGVVIPYSYTVTNNGNTTVTSAITVTDNLIPSVTCDPLPPGGLAPNASIACTGSYTTTQADVNAGSVTNTASATDGTTTSPTTQLTIPASQTPSLSIAKSSTTTSFNAAGVVIPYSYTVTNNGNTTVTSAITVTDNLIPSVTCDPLPPGGLAPNASIACTGSYTTTQADVNAGSVTNTASATDGTTTSPTTQLTIPASQTPSLSIAKSSTTTSFNAAGVVIPYSYTVTNNGNTTVTSAITVTDNLIPSVTCDPLPPGGLAPNASIACTGSYTTTQADVNAGSVTNTASATDGTTTSPTTQLTIPASQTPSLSIAKSSTTTSFNAAGVVIPYSYTVTNNGNTTVTSAITVTDNLIPSVTCDPLPPGGLAPNASIACTGSYTTTQADVNAGSVTNTASATDGTTTSPTTQLTIPASQTPSLSIAKSSTTTSFNAAGVVIPYSYTVTNNGNTTVTSAITVTDNLIPSVTCDPLPPGGLAPNASIACTGSYTTTQADVNAGSVTNTASATDGTTTSPTTQLTIPASQTPSLSIAKSSTTTSFNAAGVVIPYSYTVTNNGNTTVTSAITVTDNLIPSVTCDPLLPGGLAPNASIACTGSYTTTQADVNAGSVTNTASATDGTTTSPTTQLTIPASQTPSLSIAKSSTTTSFNAAGVVIPYSYTVTNNGNTTVTSAITVTDNLIPSVTCDPLPPGGLAPNASIACTGSYTTTQADVNAGSVTNTASATDGTTTSPTTQLTIPASQTPSLSIAKSSTTTSFNAAGVVIPYSYTVTNNGNTTVTSAITVTDNLIPSVTCDPLLPGGLAPNASIACTGSYTTTQADVNAGSVTNTASATDGTTTSPTTQLTIQYIATEGSIKLEKTASIQSFSLPGTVITYSYAITNTGNSTLNQVSLTDSKIGAISCPQTTLNPGQEMNCTGSYTTTLDDVRNGGVTNTATVTSMTVSQVVVSSTTSLTVGFDPDVIRKKTLKAINSFLKARAQLILSNQPDRRRIMNRLSPRLYECSGTPNGSITPSLTGSVNVNASVSTNELCMNTNDFDFWSEIHAGYYSTWQNDRFTRNQGAFDISYFGVDYLVTDTIVAGLLAEADLVGQKGDSLGFNKAYGSGWLVGPYLSARIAQDLYLHTRAAWGKSNNTINVLGLYADEFDTKRSLYNAELVGDWYRNDWRLSPTVGFTYYSEQQPNFMNGVNISIPGQDIALGQFNIGPEISYIYLNDSLKQFTTRLSFQGIYNFDINGKQNQQDNSLFDGFSGRIKLGTEIRFPSGLSLTPMVQYEGLGGNGLSSIQGQIQINIPLDSSPCFRCGGSMQKDGDKRANSE
jgi:hypothetical protein